MGSRASGIYINNRVRAGSLYRSIPPGAFREKVRDLFIAIKKHWKVPLEVARMIDKLS